MPREKSKHRERRSSSYSSESSYERKRSKSKHKRRSRSRDRSEGSHRRRRSISRSKHKRRSYSRSVSRERYDRPKKRSSSYSRSKRDRSRSISSSRSRSKYGKSSKKSSKRSRSSSSRSSSFDIEKLSYSKKVSQDDTETKVEKAIKAAAAAGLTMTKIPTYTYKDVEIKEEMPTIHDRNLLAEINSDSFVPKAFTSSKSKKQSQNIVIDLEAQIVKVPESDIKVQKDDSIINFDELPSEEEAREMWIKKLYQYRKKMLQGEI